MTEFDKRSSVLSSALYLNLSNLCRACRQWFFRSSLSLLVLLSGVWVWQKCGDPNCFPIVHVKITGDLTHMSRENLQRVILPFAHKGFLRLDSRRLKERLLQEPWIASVTIKRYWPDTLAVEFSTKKPVAVTANNYLLDAQSNVFSPGRVNPLSLSLPTLIGPTDQQKYLLETYQSLCPLLSKLALTIKLLELVGQQFWYLRLNNGLRLYLNRVSPDTQLKRFVEVYPDVIANRVSMIDYADLRYAHGMALKFKRRSL